MAINNLLHICVDRVLPPELEDQSHQLAVAEREDNAAVGLNPATMALVTGKKWSPGKVITCSHLGGSPTVRQNVEATAHIWEAYANIKFQFIPDGGMIRISYNTKQGSWAYIGTDCLSISPSQPNMNYGWFTDTTDIKEYHRTVLHEFGHVLGCIHEHENPDPNHPIPWNKDVVYSYYEKPPNKWTKKEVDINIFQKYAVGITQFTEWDKSSIMEYPIVPQFVTNPAYAVSWNQELSPTDISFIKEVYPGMPVPPPRPNMRTISVGQILSGTLTRAGQVDFFYLNLPVSGTRQFICEETHIAVYSADKSYSSDSQLVIDIPAGQYMIQITAGTPKNYDLLIR